MSFFRGPYKAECKGTDNGNPVYDLDGIRVVVRRDLPHDIGGAGEPVLEWSTDERTDGPKVDLRFSRGEAKIDVGALIDWVLPKLDKTDIVEYFWEDREVLDMFIEKLANQHGDSSFTGTRGSFDEARVHLLERCNSVLLYRRLDGLANALRSAEYYQRRYEAVVNVTGWRDDERPGFLPEIRQLSLAEMRARFPRDEGETEEDYNKRLYRKDGRYFPPEDPEHRIGSTNWHDAVLWWREKLIELWGLQPALDDSLAVIAAEELAQLRVDAAAYRRLMQPVPEAPLGDAYRMTSFSDPDAADDDVNNTQTEHPDEEIPF